jgi:hypothetical protein
MSTNHKFHSVRHLFAEKSIVLVFSSAQLAFLIAFFVSAKILGAFPNFFCLPTVSNRLIKVTFPSFELTLASFEARVPHTVLY